MIPKLVASAAAAARIKTPRFLAGLSPGWRAAVVASLAASVLLVALQAAMILPLLDLLPTWDQWIFAPVWHAHYEGRPVLPLLLQPYNGHFNGFPRCLMYLMGIATRWEVRAEVYASYVACLGTVLLLVRMLGGLDVRLLVLAAPVTALAFSLQQHINFMFGFPFCQMLAQFLVTASLYALTRQPRPAFVAALAAAVGASVSFASAVVIWPIGAVALLTGDRSGIRLKLACWLLAGTGCTLLARYAAVGQGPQLGWSLPAYALVVLGHPLTPQITTPVQSAWFGALALAAACGFTGLVWRTIGFKPHRPLLLIGATAPSAAFLIALGRSRYGLDQALAGQYVTVAYPMIVATLGAIGQWTLARPARWRTSLFALAAIGAVLQPVYVSSRWVPALKQWAARTSEGSLALMRGQATDAQIRQVHHPDPEVARYGVRVLKRYGLAAFRAQGPQLFELSPYQHPPMGSVDSVAAISTHQGKPCIPVGKPIRIEGWAVQSRETGGLVDAVELSVDQQPAVLAEIGLSREDVARFYGSERFRPSGYVGSLPALQSSNHRLLVVARYGSRQTVLFDKVLTTCEVARAKGP